MVWPLARHFRGVTPSRNSRLVCLDACINIAGMKLRGPFRSSIFDDGGVRGCNVRHASLSGGVLHGIVEVSSSSLKPGILDHLGHRITPRPSTPLPTTSVASLSEIDLLGFILHHSTPW